MRAIKKCILAIVILCGAPCFAMPTTSQEKIFTSKLYNVASDIQRHYGMNAIEISVLSPANGNMQNVVNGKMATDSGRTISGGDIFQIASITKTFTAYMTLNLVVNGKLKLDDRVGKFLPQYPEFANLTILELLNNTSGAFDYVDSKNWWDNLLTHKTIWTSHELIDIARLGNPDFLPGHGWHYSNTNYVLLGMVIEKIYGKSICDLEQKLIFDKYHLQNTYCAAGVIPDFIQNKLVHGYRNNTVDQTNINPSWLQAAGGLLSNSSDVAKWYSRYAPSMYSDYSYKTQFVNIKNGSHQYTDIDTLYGFGIFVMPTPYGRLLFTPGLAPGYMAFAGYLPCRNVAFSYIVSSTYTKHGLHTYVLSKLLPVLAARFPNKVKTKECEMETNVKTLQFPIF